MNQKATAQSQHEIPAETLVLQEEFSEKVAKILKNQHRNAPALAYVKTFGCQGNTADSEKLLGMLCHMGCEPALREEEADIILYNTCAVRENAEARLFGILGELKRLKRQNPNLIIGLCGCMMQQEGIAQKVEKSYHQVDFFFGTQLAYALPEFLYRVLQRNTGKMISGRTAEAVLLTQPPKLAEGLPICRNKGVQASLPIMVGCDNFCSYCIVPYVRGREVSREAQKIIAEAKEILAEGYREILLLGQNVNSYGKGLSQKFSFGELLEALNALPGDFRIRFMTSHPKDCSHDLIDTIARCEKVCPSLHLPVQSGSDRVLRAMNRGYNRATYLELVDYARKKIPGITFTSDIIVGFPGESYAEFEETLSLCKELRYQSLFTFIYSARPGTAAAKLPDPVPQAEKARWLNELIAVQHRISEEDNQNYLQKTLRVLVEHAEEEDPCALVGRSEEGMLVHFQGREKQIGEILPVRIIGAQRSELTACLL